MKIRNLLHIENWETIIGITIDYRFNFAWLRMYETAIINLYIFHIYLYHMFHIGSIISMRLIYFLFTILYISTYHYYEVI